MGEPRIRGRSFTAYVTTPGGGHLRGTIFSGCTERFFGVHNIIDGVWPLVVANILASPLIEMAPTLVRRVGHHGRLLLSGIASPLESEVLQSYQRLGMHHLRSERRAGWTMVILQASW